MPANSKDLVRQIRKFCATHGNPAMVKKYSRFFKEGYDAYGLDDKGYERCQALISKGADIPLKLALEMAPELVGSGKYEEALFAIRFVRPHIGELDAGTFKQMEKWFEYGIVNWAHADVFAGSILSPFLTNGIVPLKSFESWRTAANKFQRRSAAVVLIEYLKCEKNIKPMLAFIEPMMTDEAREVHQGVGWFLREAWKIRPAEVEKFLLKWKDTAPRLIFQYATEKMAAEEKKRFRKSK
jgi:3-methyladenine DNA glycosylase AlkD